jgi:pilus assembly protein FimV
MIITCEECNSSFNVNDSLIKDSGSKVRCSKCDSVFVAYPQPSDDDLVLETDEQITEQYEDSELEDLEASLGDFLSDDEEAEAPETSSATEDSELNLDGFDKPSEPESENAFDETDGELDLDLDFEQDEDSEMALSEEYETGDELPDLDLEDADELDLSDLELAIDDGADSGAASDAGSEDLDFDQDSEESIGIEDSDADLEVEEADKLDLSEDLDFGQDSEEPIGIEDSDAGLEEEEADELDLSDLELDLEDSAVPEEASAAGSDDLELDLDLDLESEAGSDVSEVKAETAESDADELDLSDLTDIMDEEAGTTADSEPEELNLELDLESDDLADEEVPAAVDESEGIDELDLSDLGDFMETEQAPANQVAGEDTPQDLELDLDLQMEKETKETAQTDDAAAGAGDELDFSDLEELLESDETPTIEAADDKNADELELQFDLDEPADSDQSAAAAGKVTETAEDKDFLDIEQMLEEGEATTSGQTSDYEAEITDLPLEMEAALDDATQGAEAELELDFDLESELQEKEDLFDSGPSNGQQLESNLLESDEVDFLEDADIQDTQLQDESETSVISTDEFATDDFSQTEGVYGATQVLPGAEDQPLAETDEIYEETLWARRSGRRSKKPVLVVLLLLLLAVGVLIVPNMLGIKIPYISDIKIPYLSDLDVKIPYLSDWLNPEGQDVAGNLKMTPLGNTINGKFVNNTQAGQIFVIRGQIKNGYDHPRSHIQVTGKLYQKGNKMAKKATVYCGNVLSDSDLAAMDISTIRKKLLNRAGDKRTNLKVGTGKRVPFMIVFDNLPNNLDEFSVEVESSSI